MCIPAVYVSIIYTCTYIYNNCNKYGQTVFSTMYAISQLLQFLCADSSAGGGGGYRPLMYGILAMTTFQSVAHTNATPRRATQAPAVVVLLHGWVRAAMENVNNIITICKDHGNARNEACIIGLCFYCCASTCSRAYNEHFSSNQSICRIDDLTIILHVYLCRLCCQVANYKIFVCSKTICKFLLVPSAKIHTFIGCLGNKYTISTLGGSTSRLRIKRRLLETRQSSNGFGRNNTHHGTTLSTVNPFQTRLVGRRRSVDIALRRC